jgi:hypothetical protein
MARTLPGTSKSLAVAFQRLRTQAPQYDRISAQLPPCMSMLQRFFENTMSIQKFTDANGSFPRADEVVDTLAPSDLSTPALNLKKISFCPEGK